MACIVRAANHSGIPYTGWLRTKVDERPPHASGRVGDVFYVLGQQEGLDTWAVDLKITIHPGQDLKIDLASAEPEDWQMPPLPSPAEIVEYFGGTPKVDGEPAHVLSHGVDGACVVTHLMRQSRHALVTHAWVRWNPEQPEVAFAEAVTVESSPAVQSMSETLTSDLRLTFGDALIWVPGAGLGGRIMAAGDTLADGQGRALPMLLFWPRRATPAQMASAMAMAELGVSAVGVSRIHPEGAPMMPDGMSGIVWGSRHWGQVERELHTRGETFLGPLARTGSPGDQEIQTYHVGGEALLSDGVGCDVVRYLNGIREYALMPCNHLEADGTPIDIARHPNLRIWDGRPHSSGTDLLGKTAQLSMALAGGHWGPDVQHHYIGGLTSVARMRWSPLTQWMMERQATVYLGQRTDTPGWGTSGWDSPREWGCEADLVFRLWCELKNRTVAHSVVDRFRSRLAKLFVPWMHTRELIWTRFNDPRTNPTGEGAQWLQESFAAMALWRTCKMLGGLQEVQDVCVRVARKVFDTAWHLDTDGSYRAQPQGPVDGSANAGNPATHGFDAYGMPCCVWLVLQVDPTNAKALAIWGQLLANKGEKARRWMLPLGAQ